MYLYRTQTTTVEGFSRFRGYYCDLGKETERIRVEYLSMNDSPFSVPSPEHDEQDAHAVIKKSARATTKRLVIIACFV